MPILAREEELHPPDLLESPGESPWWAIYTMPRREKEFLRRLRPLGVGFYCPMVERKHRSPNGRLRTSYLPLFASYVFVRGDESARYQALTTGCVSRTLAINNLPQFEADLRQIHRLLVSGAAVTPEARLEPGMPVRVQSGPLAGLEGRIVRRERQTKLVVAIDFLQQGASAVVEDFDVERIGG